MSDSNRYPASHQHHQQHRIGPSHHHDRQDEEEDEDEPAAMAGLEETLADVQFAEDVDDGHQEGDDEDEDVEEVRRTVGAAVAGTDWNPDDEEFLNRSTLDRRLWQQVLEIHTAGAGATAGHEVDDDTRPLQELAVLAEAEAGVTAAVDTDVLDLQQHIDPQGAVAASALPRRRRIHDNSLTSLAEAGDPTVGGGSRKRQRKLPATSRQRIPLTDARKRMVSAMDQKQAAQKAFLDAEAERDRAEQRLSQAREAVQQAEKAFEEAGDDVYTQLIEEPGNWNECVKLFIEFTQTHGHSRVPRNPSKEMQAENPEITKLSRWVGQCRTDFKKEPAERTHLDDINIFILNKLGFDWDPSETKFRARYGQLKKYKEKHNHCRVPYNKYNREDDGLGAWVKRQQYQYKLYQAGKPNELTEDRIRLLDELGMVWSRRMEDWSDRLDEVRAYKEKHGNVVVPPSNRSLHEWVRDQRTQWKKFEEDPTQSTLNTDQVSQLEDVGVDLDLRGAKWQTRFMELMEFRKRHGHTVVPPKYPFNQPLSNWCSTQRRHYRLLKMGKKSQMTQDRAELLSEAGFEWEVSSERRSKLRYKKTWDERFAELAAHKDETGSCSLKTDTDHGLRTWCKEQKNEYVKYQGNLKTTMTKERIERLTKLGFWCDVSTSIVHGLAKSWDEFFGELLAHFLVNGKYDITAKRDGDLHYWVEEQKEEYSKYVAGEPSKMTGNRVQKLQAVKFPFSKIRSKKKIAVTGKSWEEMYAELLQFRIFQKSWDVPNSYQDLFHWVSKQREIYHQPHSELSLVQKQHIKKLQIVGFPFLPPPTAPQHPPQQVQQAIASQVGQMGVTQAMQQFATNNTQAPFPSTAVNPQFPYLSRRFPFLNPTMNLAGQTMTTQTNAQLFPIITNAVTAAFAATPAATVPNGGAATARQNQIDATAPEPSIDQDTAAAPGDTDSMQHGSSEANEEDPPTTTDTQNGEH